MDRTTLTRNLGPLEREGLLSMRPAPLLMPKLANRVPPAAAMGVFPMILVPIYAVPVSVLQHILPIVRLTREAPFGSRRSH